ncbi:DUF6221 family protein [Streptomyces sp. NPDC085596]|uniref:DUF6221 family protein n=1 Tax=Streptomyces sp. NPDC085596 TaxID=3365731 RepID=UPI0037D4F115
MDDLVQWLGAQLDEDERIAHAASSGPWNAYAGPEMPWISKGELIHPVRTWERMTGQPSIMTEAWFDSRFIAEWNPARVLREIDAKRRLLDLHAPDVMGTHTSCTECGQGYEMHDWGPAYPCTTVRLLAMPYEARPGYREEWRP